MCTSRGSPISTTRPHACACLRGSGGDAPRPWRAGRDRRVLLSTPRSDERGSSRPMRSRPRPLAEVVERGFEAFPAAVRIVEGCSVLRAEAGAIDSFKRASSLFVSTGPLSSSWRQWSGVSSKRFCSSPSGATSDITSSSRSGSIGGFVTCAKSCLKYAKRSCGRSDRTAGGVSVPIEPTASWPLIAIGAISILSSSKRVAERSLAARRASRRRTRKAPIAPAAAMRAA